MAKADVHIFKIQPKMNDNDISAGLIRLFKSAGFEDIFCKGHLTAVKTHFGERGNIGYIEPPYVKTCVTCVQETGAEAFLTDTNTLYKGSRSNSRNHLLVAAEHGFSIETMGVPVIIADGLIGQNRAPVPLIGGKHFRQAQLAPDIVHADSMLVLSHVTGHMLTGYAGALKNLAMGCATRGGKLAMHENVKPTVNEVNCTSCGKCSQWCPAGAVMITGGSAKIDHKLCIGCGECLAVCRNDAVSIGWSESQTGTQEKIAEYALGVVGTKKDALGCINFITYVTMNCNCMGKIEEPEIPDIGIVASVDPVAVDMASIDLSNKADKGGTLFKRLYPEIDPIVQIRHAEHLGVGTSEYTLVEVE